MKQKWSSLRGFAVGMVLAGSCSVLVLAHTHLQKSEPADGVVLTSSPAQVELWFDQKPDLAVSRIDVKGPSGPVEVGPTHAMAEKSIMAAFTSKLGDGKYVVGWQAAGDDGHVSKGELSFVVKSAQPSAH